MGFNPLYPRKYVGTDEYIVPCVTRNRRPTSADVKQPETGRNYPVVSVWQVGKNPTTGSEGELWLLSKIVSNLAYWVQISSGSTPSGPSLTLSDTADTLVYPSSSGNIQLEAGAGMTITADAANNKLVVASSSGGTSVDSFDTNVGGPVAPTALGLINVNASSTTYTDGSTANTIKTEVQGTNHALFVGRGANTPAANLAVGTTGQVMTASTGADPAFEAIGTNSGLTNHGVILGQNNSAFVATAAGSDHSIFMGVSSADPAFTTTGTPYVSGISFDTGSNTLQRYITWTAFTPVIAGSTGAGTATYQEQSGRYCVIGNVVFVNINLSWTGHTGTGDMLVTGLPYVFAAAQSFYPMACMMQNIALPASTKWVVADGTNNTTQMELTASLDGSAFSKVQMSAAGSVHIAGQYPADP